MMEEGTDQIMEICWSSPERKVVTSEDKHHKMASLKGVFDEMQEGMNLLFFKLAPGTILHHFFHIGGFINILIPNISKYLCGLNDFAKLNSSVFASTCIEM